MGQQAAVPRSRILLREPFMNRDGSFVGFDCLGRTPERADRVAEIVKGAGETITMIGGLGVVVGELLVERDCLALLGFRRRRLACL